MTTDADTSTEATAPAPDALDHLRSVLPAMLRKYSQDDVSIHAMSLTYTTILSIVPLLAVSFSVLKAFGVHNQIEPFLDQTLAPLGPGGEALSARIVGFVQNLEVGVLGAVGLAGLFYTVVSLVSSIENALNRIWGARQGRDWLSRFRDYLSIILVGPVLVFSALALMASAEQHDLVQRVFAIAPGALWFATVALPYLMLCGGFVILYRFMPNTYVSWSAAAVGGITGGVAWKIAGSAFTTFVAGSTRYAAIYSSFAILVLTLIWIYVSWLIVLIAAEVAYLWQHPTDVLSRLRDLTIAAHERNGLELMRTITANHLAGEPPLTRAALATATDLPISMVDEVVELMIAHRILLESERPPGIALAKPPERVSVFEVLTTLRGDAPELRLRDTPAPITQALAICGAAVESALAGLTLRGLASASDDAPEPAVDRVAHSAE